MSRVAVAHRNPSEAKPRLALLRRAGHQVRLLGPDIREELPALGRRAPEVFVIDLALARDLTQKGVRAFGLDSGWVDYKICAIDEDTSGLRFARREARKT